MRYLAAEEPSIHLGFLSPHRPNMPLAEPRTAHFLTSRVSEMVRLGIPCFARKNRMLFSQVPNCAAISAALRFRSVYSLASQSRSQYGFGSRLRNTGPNASLGKLRFNISFFILREIIPHY